MDDMKWAWQDRTDSGTHGTIKGESKVAEIFLDKSSLIPVHYKTATPYTYAIGSSTGVVFIDQMATCSRTCSLIDPRVMLKPA